MAFTIEGYANTKAKDRVGDIILPSAFEKGMEHYLANPILLYQHNSDSPIGKVIDYEIDDIGLKVSAVVSETEPKIRKLIEEGVLKAFSVGFALKEQEYDPETDTSYIKELELMELSIVSIPANQFSLFEFVGEDL